MHFRHWQQDCLGQTGFMLTLILGWIPWNSLNSVFMFACAFRGNKEHSELYTTFKKELFSGKCWAFLVWAILWLTNGRILEHQGKSLRKYECLEQRSCTNDWIMNTFICEHINYRDILNISSALLDIQFISNWNFTSSIVNRFLKISNNGE